MNEAVLLFTLIGFSFGFMIGFFIGWFMFKAILESRAKDFVKKGSVDEKECKADS